MGVYIPLNTPLSLTEMRDEQSLTLTEMIKYYITVWKINLKKGEDFIIYKHFMW